MKRHTHTHTHIQIGGKFLMKAECLLQSSREGNIFICLNLNQVEDPQSRFKIKVWGTCAKIKHCLKNLPFFF